ncbi:MAG TPA: hypothetical protein VLT36_18725 [Candidatus Dormibacteraeota bacterium]|nr:hypothetical protein [Candidatus Dormibacteraeota bacterium]
MINGQTVDLTPLFKWWGKHEGQRPLANWVHISGTITGTNAMGWIVTGHAEPADEKQNEEGKLVLKHPPLADFAEFDALRRQKQDLEKQRTHAESQANGAQSQLQDQKGKHRHAGTTDAATLRQQENNAKERLKGLDTQIKEVDKKLAAYPSQDHYHLDCFALTAGSYGKLEVYDYGIAFH